MALLSSKPLWFSSRTKDNNRKTQQTRGNLEHNPANGVVPYPSDCWSVRRTFFKKKRVERSAGRFGFFRSERWSVAQRKRRFTRNFSVCAEAEISPKSRFDTWAALTLRMPLVPCAVFFVASAASVVTDTFSTAAAPSRSRLSAKTVSRGRVIRNAWSNCGAAHVSTAVPTIFAFQSP